jgi:hypothetical protein
MNSISIRWRSSKGHSFKDNARFSFWVFFFLDIFFILGVENGESAWS